MLADRYPTLSALLFNLTVMVEALAITLLMSKLKDRLLITLEQR